MTADGTPAAPASMFREEVLAAARARGSAADGDGGLGERLRLPVWPVAAGLTALVAFLAVLLGVRTEVRAGLTVITAAPRVVTVAVPPDLDADRLRAARIVVSADGREIAGRVAATQVRRPPGVAVPVTMADIETSAPLPTTTGIRVRAILGSRSLMSDIVATERVSGQ